MKLIDKLEVRRSHRVVQFFLERAKNWEAEGRDFSIYWSIAHMISTTQIIRLLAVKRGLDPDICAIAGAIHDIATMESGKSENHATRALDYIAPLIKAYNESSCVTNDALKITDAEIALLEEIIPKHSNKKETSANPYAEALKDADAIDRYLHGVEATEPEMPRLTAIFTELGSNFN